MNGESDGLEWRHLQIALVVVALIVGADVVGWKVHDIMYPQPTRLERTVFCLKDNQGLVAVVPAGDPLAASAGDGSLTTTIEGNDVTVVLASSPDQAIEIERTYRTLGTDLVGRLERRGRTVYLWRNVSSPTQRQHAYDCQY